MDTLYSIDEMRKSRQREIANHVEANRNYNLVKTSQSYRPGVFKRIICSVQTNLGEILNRLKCAFALKSVAYFRKSKAELKPC
jgi:hypothetical protein